MTASTHPVVNIRRVSVAENAGEFMALQTSDVGLNAELPTLRIGGLVAAALDQLDRLPEILEGLVWRYSLGDGAGFQISGRLPAIGVLDEPDLPVVPVGPVAAGGS